MAPPTNNHHSKSNTPAEEQLKSDYSGDESGEDKGEEES